MIQDPDELRTHVDGFYITLFSARPRGGLALAENFWDEHLRVSPEENQDLLNPFEEDEVEAIVKSMNPASAPGPDGLPVRFCQTFWTAIKGEIMALFREFSRGTLDVSRLNFGIISLIPKV